MSDVAQHIIGELSRHGRVFEHLLKGHEREQYLWRPAPGKWCLLEVVCHLHDEEREDFRTRVRHCLETPADDFPAIDPVGWVTDRDYAGQDFEERLGAFLRERRNSVEWLSSLEDPDWTSACVHPKLGPMSAGLFLSSWLAHDHIHIRQINRMKYGMLEELSEEPLDYAGNW